MERETQIMRNLHKTQVNLEENCSQDTSDLCLLWLQLSLQDSLLTRLGGQTSSAISSGSGGSSSSR